MGGDLMRRNEQAGGIKSMAVNRRRATSPKSVAKAGMAKPMRSGELQRYLALCVNLYENVSGVVALNMSGVCGGVTKIMGLA
jgi:hypothetical protein